VGDRGVVMDNELQSQKRAFSQKRGVHCLMFRLPELPCVFCQAHDRTWGTLQVENETHGSHWLHHDTLPIYRTRIRVQDPPFPICKKD
jgi:hypothetical protein